MSNSLSFDSVDLSTYGLIVLMAENSPDFIQAADSIQLLDKGYAFDSYRTPKSIIIPVLVTGTSLSNLQSNLDNIKLKLNKYVDCVLKLDVQNDRQWNARFVSMEGEYHSAKSWWGSIEFIAYDPVAYGTSEVSNTSNVNADPKTISETTGGTGLIRPVFTLTAGADLTGVTISIENDTTGEVIEWTGDIDTAETLEIDCANYTVKLAGTESMATVSGTFPKLLPAQANSIIVTGFGTAGTLNIKYRNAYV